MKQTIAILIAIILLGGAAYYFLTSNSSYEASPDDTNQITTTETPTANTGTERDNDTDTNNDNESDERPGQEVIGASQSENDITVYHYGDGETEVLFIGGIHGGYSYSTSLVAYELMDYLEENESDLPDNLTISVIPVMNPDGLQSVTGSLGRFDASDVSVSDSERVAGRFNADEVDLNRNFDCDWSESSTWRNQTVSGGDAPLSEPEAAAVANYVADNEIAAAVVWFAAEGKVYPSACSGSPSSDSVELAATFASAANYDVEAEFDAYTINGDMVNWFAKEGIPAISVLLPDHTSADWRNNRLGIEAVIEYLSQE